MNAYNLVLSSGAKVRIEATSPVDAIDKALWSFRGQTVTWLYCGFDGQNTTVTQGCVGGLDYDIPRHEPIDLKAVETPRKPKAEQNQLFPFA
jgi:hypothetical protein